MLLWCCAVENVLQVPFLLLLLNLHVAFVPCESNEYSDIITLTFIFFVYTFSSSFVGLLFSRRFVNNVISFVFILFKVEKKICTHQQHIIHSSFFVYFLLIFQPSKHVSQPCSQNTESKHVKKSTIDRNSYIFGSFFFFLNKWKRLVDLFIIY